MRNKKTKTEETKVTILIPTFNRSDYVQEAIQSALDQTYPCHIIVCDHGSTDDTPEIMKKYKDRVQYVRKEEDFGPHFCWLDGVLHCKTEYVKILYDDDWIEPTFVEKTLSLIQEDVSCVITNANISYENGGKKSMGKSTFFNQTGTFNNSKIGTSLWLFTSVISPTCCLFRRNELIDGIYQGKLLKKGGSYYHGVGPDMFVMLLGFLRYKKVGFVNEYLATFRAHEKSISIDANKDNQKKANIKKSYEEVVEFYYFLRFFKFIEIFYLTPTRILRRFLLKNKNIIKEILKIFRSKD
jgi:glycosyltransferase involved in cell wall biosynthesis